MRLIQSCLALASLLGASQAAAIDKPSKASSDPIVNLGYAQYKGTRLPAGVDQFLGMRFAAAPVGDLRFRAPADPVRVHGVQDASKFGPLCLGVNQAPSAGLAEDCLFVNVFKPSKATRTSKLPVWVFIQGGGYANNADANFNATTIINNSGDNLVFVNFNYRVGALGFLAGEKVRYDGDLNAGLLDQRKLLHWVRANIAKFGGDPNHVVIHGDSAGGGSVSYHLTAYEGKKDDHLFVGAIPESPFWPTQRTAAEMDFQYDQLMVDTSCSSMQCLRELDIGTLMNVTSSFGSFPGAASDSPRPLWYWLPVIDGDLVVDHMHNLFGSNKFIHVPLLAGDDTDEGTSFAYNAKTQDEMNVFLKNNYPHLNADQLGQIDKLYPLMDPLPMHEAYFPSAAAAYGDATFTCAGNDMTAAVARFFDSKRAWNYRYNVIDPDNTANGRGVPHVFEKTAVFGIGNSNGPVASYATINAPIIPVTMDYFTSFVRDLNPNTHKDSSSPIWEPWGTGSGQRLRLQTNATAMEAIPKQLTDKCNLWKTLSSTTES